MALAKIIRDLRMQAGLSQEELARRAGVTQKLISKIEVGKVRESRKLPAIARAFGLTVEQLLNCEPGPNQSDKSNLNSDDAVPLLGFAVARETAPPLSEEQLDEIWRGWPLELKAQIVATVTAARRRSVRPQHDDIMEKAAELRRHRRQGRNRRSGSGG